MKIDILTLFPEIFESFLEWSMIKKAREIGALETNIHNLRDWGTDKRGTVDDRPYGGGPGMILRPEPIYGALCALISNFQFPVSKKNKSKNKNQKIKIILLSAKGKTFNQKKAIKFSGLDRLIMVCGHYEGVDERVRKHMIDEDISVGNYILSGGELPAMIVTDSVSRLQKGVLEKEGASEIESFSPGLSALAKTQKLNPKTGLLEYPHYTRPEEFKGWKVPEVLLSGNHAEIKKWRISKIKKK